MSKPVVRIGLWVLLLALLAGVLAWGVLRDGGSPPWSPSAAATPGPFDRSRALRVGYAVEAPYAWVDSHGTVTGESPLLAREVARRLGLTVEWVQLGFDQLIPSLERGQIDVIASGLFITPERARRVRFADPSLVVHPGLLLPRQPSAGTPPGYPAPSGVWTWPALKQAMAGGRPRPLRVAVIDQSTEWALLQAAPGGRDALVVVPDAVTGQAALLAGLADALALSLPTVSWMASQRPEALRAVPLQPDPQHPGGPSQNQVAAAFRLQDEALWRDWNRVQPQVLANPAHRALLQGLGLLQALDGPAVAGEVRR